MTVPAETETMSARLPAVAARWLREALTAVEADPSRIDTLLTSAGRHCGRQPLPGDPPPPVGRTVDDAVRALLLARVPWRGATLADALSRLYWQGDAAERRGVLRSLSCFGSRNTLGALALPLVHDALRTNDPRLIAAALGDYAARHLDAAAFRQAVLKCLFSGIPLVAVTGLDERADPELTRMLTDYAEERRAAGRAVPSDIEPFIGAGPTTRE
ncbi:EboA domain-containing protein [Kitasatospora sp. NPDC057541]|uniref:EboA domain-containing protein n=1 Tax=unclassified Kitasatospora TaxID=2633591 RepID=UPI00368C8B54